MIHAFRVKHITASHKCESNHQGKHGTNRFVPDFTGFPIVNSLFSKNVTKPQVYENLSHYIVSCNIIVLFILSNRLS